MPTATMTLRSGATVQIEGSVDEVKALLKLYDTPLETDSALSPSRIVRAPQAASAKPTAGKDLTILADVVNTIKNCDEATAIESRILDENSQIDRVLLPLYVIHEYLDDRYGLSSGDINKITTQLGVPVSTANVSTVLARRASRYVIGDRVRESGVAVKYKLSRRGVEYMKEVLGSP